MTTEGRQPIEGAISPLPTERSGERLERLREESGLTWRILASQMDVKDRRRLELLLPAGSGRRQESSGNANRDTGGPGG
ncbi:MAG: hypothetical protein F4X66_17750 [Chloroflexi bacterium]|nr:hypothetical protein [Chloroflexota bacterium]